MKAFSCFKFVQKIIAITLLITVFTQCKKEEELPAVFTITPKNLDFGNVIIEESLTKTIVIGNTGEGDLEIEGITLGGENRSEFTNDIKVLAMKAGSRNSFSVIFSPKTEGAKTSEIIITTNVGEFTVNLTGNGTPKPVAIFNINLTNYNFGDVEVGKDSETELKITNTGNADLIIQTVTVQDNTNATASNFSVNNYSNVTVSPNTETGIIINFVPVSEGVKNGTLKITTNVGEFTVNLTGNGTPKPVAIFNINLTNYDFGDVEVGKNSETELKVTNTGNADLIIQTVTVQDNTNATASNFSVNNYSNVTVSPNTETGIIINFVPVSEGVKNGTLKITTNVGEFTVNLTGNGTPKPVAIFNINPTNYDFGDVEVRKDSETDLKITNTGNADLIIQTVTVQDNTNATASNFSVNNYSNVTVSPNTETGIIINFVPVSEGVKNGTLKITTNVGEFTVNLTGNGVTPTAAFNIDPTSHNFGNVSTAGNGAAKIFTITNTGDANLVINSIVVDEGTTTPGTTPNYYINQAPQNVTITPNGTLTVDIIFLPNNAGTKSATLKITTNVGEFTVNLTGNGVTPTAAFSINPTSHNFGNVSTAGSIAAKTFTITNTGDANLVINSVVVVDEVGAGVVAYNFYINQAPQNVTIAPNDTLTVEVSFMPRSRGAKSATLKINTNIGEFTINLTGNGV